MRATTPRRNSDSRYHMVPLTRTGPAPVNNLKQLRALHETSKNTGVFVRTSRSKDLAYLGPASSKDQRGSRFVGQSKRDGIEEYIIPDRDISFLQGRVVIANPVNPHRTYTPEDIGYDPLRLKLDALGIWNPDLT